MFDEARAVIARKALPMPDDVRWVAFTSGGLCPVASSPTLADLVDDAARAVVGYAADLEDDALDPGEAPPDVVRAMLDGVQIARVACVDGVTLDHLTAGGGTLAARSTGPLPGTWRATVGRPFDCTPPVLTPAPRTTPTDRARTAICEAVWSTGADELVHVVDALHGVGLGGDVGAHLSRARVRLGLEPLDEAAPDELARATLAVKAGTAPAGKVREALDVLTGKAPRILDGGDRVWPALTLDDVDTAGVALRCAIGLGRSLARVRGGGPATTPADTYDRDEAHGGHPPAVLAAMLLQALDDSAGGSEPLDVARLDGIAETARALAEVLRSRPAIEALADRDAAAAWLAAEDAAERLDLASAHGAA